MAAYLSRRVAYSIVVLLIVSVVDFAFMRVLGDPVTAILGQGAAAGPAAISRLRHQLGLDEPIALQYLSWLGNAALGDLGQSYQSPISVSEALLQRLPVTLELTVLALVIAVIAGFTGGTIAALRPGTRIDISASLFAVGSLSIPNFWLGILLIFVFSLQLGWLPSSGYTPLLEDPLENLTYMILPSVTLAAFYTGRYVRFVRSVMADIFTQDYMRTAEAKGLSRIGMIRRHAVKNALIPLLTVVALDLAGLFGGAVVTETVFSLPGVGTLLTQSILNKDLPVVQGVVLFITAAVIVTNLVVDILYGILNPRARVTDAEA